MGVQKLNEKLSLYSKENLSTLYQDVIGNNESLMSYAEAGSDAKIQDFGQDYLKKEVENFDHKRVMGQQANQNMDFGSINNGDEKEVIKERTNFFQDHFLPFLQNPKDPQKVLLLHCSQLESQKDAWVKCFGNDEKNEKVKKSLEYRNAWYEFSEKEIKGIRERSGKNKKNKSNNDSGDHEEVFSKDDRYEAAKERIEKLKEEYKYENYKYENNNRNILEDFKKDYSTTTFLEELNKFLGKSDNNPLGSDSNLQKFLDANLSQLQKVLGGLEKELEGELDEKALGKGEDLEDNNSGDGKKEKSYLKKVQDKVSSDEASEEMKQIYNVKKVLLQYLFDMANMDLDFCHSKIKIYSKSNKSEENNDEEDEENEDNEGEEESSGIFGKIKARVKNLFTGGYNGEKYKNYCSFLIGMISNLGDQIEDIGAVNVSSEDKEKEKKTDDENKNGENSASGNENAKNIFYDPYWYINFLEKSEGDNKAKNLEDAKKLKNYYLNRAKLLKLYEYLGDEKNVDLKQILESIIPKQVSVIDNSEKNGFPAPTTKLKTPEVSEKLKTSEVSVAKSLLEKFNNSYRYKNTKNKNQPFISNLERNIFIRSNVIKKFEQVSYIRKQIQNTIQDLESKIKDKIKTAKKNCEYKHKTKYKTEIEAAKLLSEGKEFSNDNNRKELEEIFLVPKEDYYKATGGSVTNIDLQTFDEQIKNLKTKLLIGDDKSKYFKYPILDKKKFEKAEYINENYFPKSYDEIDPKLSKYFDDSSGFLKDILKTDEEKKQEQEEKKRAEEEKKKAEEEKKKAEKEAEEKAKEKTESQERANRINKIFENENIDKRFKGVKLSAIGSFKTKSEKKDEEDRERKKQEEIKGIVEKAREKVTLEEFWEYLGVNDINNKDEIYEVLKKKHPDIDEKQYDQIYEDLKEKYNDLKKKDDLMKAEKAKARSTPEGFLKYLSDEFKIEDKNKVMDELKKRLVDDRKNDANADKSKTIYEKLKNHYEKLKQKESEKAAEAFQKSLAGEAPPKKTMRDFFTPKESYKIDNLLFTEKEENLVSYDKYVIMANDENPSPRRYLNFLGMRDISELETAYKNFEKYSDNKKYESNLNYYKEQYNEALKKASKGSVVSETENKINQLNANIETNENNIIVQNENIQINANKEKVEEKNENFNESSNEVINNTKSKSIAQMEKEKENKSIEELSASDKFKTKKSKKRKRRKNNMSDKNAGRWAVKSK